MKNYFDSTGKYEVLADKLADLIPPIGSVKNPKQNPKLEKYRKLVNAYYNLYNNGGGNPHRRTAYYFPRCITLAKRNEWKKVIQITEPIMNKAILDASEEQGLDFEVKLEKIQNLVIDLRWDYDRMSSSGQETYAKLCKVLGL